MALADDLVASYFGQPKTANLMSGAKVVASGVTPLDWDIKGGVAAAVKTFGPFQQSTSFDTVALVDFLSGTVIERYPLGGEVSVIAGMNFVHRFQFKVSDVEAAA